MHPTYPSSSAARKRLVVVVMLRIIRPSLFSRRGGGSGRVFKQHSKGLAIKFVCIGASVRIMNSNDNTKSSSSAVRIVVVVQFES